MSDTKKVQEQFSKDPGGYVTSEVHAAGDSLAWLAAHIQPEGGGLVLDVATGGGHTARLFTGRSGVAVAGDLTHAMLRAAVSHAADLLPCQHDSHALPFAAGTFDAVTCRIAPHHFRDVALFVQEAARVLKPDGVFGLVDNIVSGEPAVGRYINAFEALRDPSHHEAYTLDDWLTFFFRAGLAVEAQATLQKRIEFEPWVARMQVSPADQDRLRALLLQAPTAARDWLKPEQAGRQISFQLSEVLLRGRKTSPH
ncbi:MAG: class I SAM-dependent methyltransferase [Anaerolineae bacterium]